MPSKSHRPKRTALELPESWASIHPDHTGTVTDLERFLKCDIRLHADGTGTVGDLALKHKRPGTHHGEIAQHLPAATILLYSEGVYLVQRTFVSEFGLVQEDAPDAHNLDRYPRYTAQQALMVACVHTAEMYERTRKWARSRSQIMLARKKKGLDGASPLL